MIFKQKKYHKFLAHFRNKLANIEYFIPIIFLFINLIILYFPYWINKYEVPVGWDTAYYIHRIEFIKKNGLFSLFRKNNYMHFYSVFGYLLSIIFNINAVTVEKFLPIIMGISLTLINYLVIKELYNSRKLEVVVLVFSIFNINNMRLVCGLHRNLFSLILVELSLLILLPKCLMETSKKRAVLLTLLLVYAGLSQIETFFIAIVTLSGLLIQSLLLKSYNRIKYIFLIIFISTLIYIFINLPFLAEFLSYHMLFNPIFTSSPVIKCEDYITYLGGSLIPLYFIGLYMSIKEYMKERKDLYLILFIWNIILLFGSLLPFFGIVIYSWRLILITTIPIISTIGITILHRWSLFIKIEENKPIQINKILIVITLIILTPFISIHYINNTQKYFRPWISNETYEKFKWINQDNRTKPSIVVINFNKGIYTDGLFRLYANWIRAILGPDTKIYFGNLHSLIFGSPTPFSDKSANRTSYIFWEEFNDINITEFDIYLINEWYSISNNKNLVEVFPGIYKLSKDRFYQNIIFNAFNDIYNKTQNSYGLNVDWSSQKVLEFYRDPFVERFKDPEYFYVSYLFPMSDKLNYTLKLRWFDYPIEKNAPITIKFDGINITSLHYTGSKLPQIVEVSLPKVNLGYHLISFEMSGISNKRQIMTLEYLEISTS